MFLDPEPRTSRRPHSQSDVTAYIPPTNATRPDQRIIRKPLLEKSSNGTIKQTLHRHGQDEPLKPTVRLVRQSPSVASIKKEIFGDTDKQKGRRAQLKISEYEERKLGENPDETGFRVSDAPSPTNEGLDADASLDNSWQESDVDANDLPAWKRRSLSSSDLSDATTLKGSSVARFSYNHSTYSRSTRISSGTTLRDNFDSSVLHETDLDDLPESASEAGPLEHQSPSVTEFSIPDTPARASIRTVQSSDSSAGHASDHTATPRPASSRRNSWSSPTSSQPVIDNSPPQHLSHFIPAIPPRLSSKRASSASFGSSSVRRTSLDFSRTSPSVSQRYHSPYIPSSPEQDALIQESHDHSPVSSSFIDTPNISAYTSSPNFLAYGTSPTRPRSRSHPLRGEASYDSITSRLQSSAQPGPSCTLASKESWASFDPSSSLDTLPSIHVPRRRLRQVKGSLSLDAARRSQTTSQDMTVDVAYPAHAFHGNLSTIMSESDRSQSRVVSQPFSNFSMGSGVTTGDESTMLASAEWPPYPSYGNRFQSKSFESYVAGSSSEDEPGDMTLNLYREQSAKPQPLFRTRALSAESQSLDKRYNGPLPPLPPMPPHDAEEHRDMLAELSSPNLRSMRSGYSLRRQRSNSTPVQSRRDSIVSNESERWSTSSNIFPTWAKHFYSGNIALGSMSMISLQSMPSPPTRDGAQNGMRFERRSSTRNQRSITAPQQSTPSTIATRAPSASHILPAIFRPRTRPLRKSIGAVRDLIRPSEQRAMPRQSEDTAGTESMVIEPAPPTGTSATSHLPSGHPKFGVLQDTSDAPPRPLPRAYSKQKYWNRMTFPRPMSKDRLSEYGQMPHLAPTRRSSSQLDTWRPPSFVESIDLIIKSRGHRQIFFFLAGFLCPLIWMVGAVMPLPKRPVGAFDPGKITPQWLEDNTDVHMGQHEAGEAAARWRQEKAWRQGVWWRNVNRVMSVLGLLIIGAVIAIAIVATR